MSITGPALQSVAQQLQTVASQAADRRPIAAPADTPVNSPDQATSFADALTHSIDRIDALKQSAAATGEAFERGQAGIGVNDVMVDMEKAGLAFEMGVQVRNRVINAYKDIMNMQV